MVNSPPSRGLIRTPACSPSPLKRVSSSRENCYLPNPRAGDGTSRKLILAVEEAPVPKPLVDAVIVPTIPTAVINGSTQVGAESLPRQRILAEPPRTVLPESTGTPVAYRKKLNETISRLPPRGSRSLSAGEALGTTERRKRKAAGAERPSPCDHFVGIGGPHYRSRREDILRGLA